MSPMTVIVGNNASGKSVILQIISLLCDSVQEEFDSFIGISESEGGRLIMLHSVVFLDFVDKKDIIFLYRDEADGRAVGKKIFEIPELIDKLKYMYPGEIIYNMDIRRFSAISRPGLTQAL